MTAVAAPTRRPAGATRWRVVASPRFATAVSVVAFLAAWQFVAPVLPTRLIPTPSSTLSFMWDEVLGVTAARQTLWVTFGISLLRLGIGFLAAFLIGVPIGLLMGAFRSIERALSDFVIVGLAVPTLVWALLTGLWFGLGNTAPIASVVLAASPFVIVNTFQGVRDTPKELTDMARAFGVGRVKVTGQVVLPSLMPFFFASLRYGLASGWKALVIAEVFASTSGAGWMIQFWRDAGRPRGVFGYALFFILFALMMEQLLFQPLSRRVFRWRMASSTTGGRAKRG